MSPDRADKREAGIQVQCSGLKPCFLKFTKLQNYDKKHSSIQNVLHLPSTMPWHHDRGNSEEPTSESNVGSQNIHFILVNIILG